MVESLDSQISLDDGQTSNDAALNAAFVSASADLEETLISPILIPAVGNQPVVGVVLSSPTKDLDGVAFVNDR